MHREGHIGVALAIYAPLAFLVCLIGGPRLAAAGGVAFVGVALVPDLDVRVPLVTHRGPTHTLWFAGVIGGIGLVGGAVVGYSSTGVLAALGLGILGALCGVGGIVAHLAGDVFTPMGIRPLEPWNSRIFTLSWFTAANPIANYAAVVIGGGVSLGALVAAMWIRGLFA